MSKTKERTIEQFETPVCLRRPGLQQAGWEFLYGSFYGRLSQFPRGGMRNSSQDQSVTVALRKLSISSPQHL